MTEMRDVIIFVGFWRPPMPPPSPDATGTILNYLNDRERRAPLSFVGFWRPPMTPPPDATILNYLTDREGGGGGGARTLPFVGFRAPSPYPDATILNYLNDREGGAIIFCRILPPPLSQTPQYLTILMTGRGGGGGRQYPVRS